MSKEKTAFSSFTLVLPKPFHSSIAYTEIISLVDSLHSFKLYPLLLSKVTWLARALSPVGFIYSAVDYHGG